MSSPRMSPLPASDWTPAAARHLLGRAGFGVPLARVEQLAAMSLENAVAALVDYERFPPNLVEPDGLKPPSDRREMRMEMKEKAREQSNGRPPTEEQRRQLEFERRRKANELMREERQAIEHLKLWWIERMLTTPRPLEEKMTLFWHGHFAVSAEKVKSAYSNYQLNKIFRQNATGNFKLLTYEVGISPAMMRYLDNAMSNKRHPNENWARELMELFTLGKGNYTENDIKESARAFTGWSTDGMKFVYNPRLHDEGRKTFLGRTGNLNGNDVLDIIFEQKAASRFISRKLWNYFAYPDPDDEIIEDLAATLRADGFNLKPVLRRMFLAREFYSPQCREAQIKSPAQLTVSMLSQLEVDANKEFIGRYVAFTMRQMGQDLFYPPNVKGWDGGRAWINTNTLMTRYNLSNFLVQGVATQMPGRLGKFARKNKQGKNAGLDAMSSPEDREMAAVVEEAVVDPQLMDDSGAQPGPVGDYAGPKGYKLPIAPFNVREFFARGNGLTLTKIADFLADYFYGRPISEIQRREVVEALAGKWDPEAKLDAENWDIDRLRGAVHLMLSAAEYQVC